MEDVKEAFKLLLYLVAFLALAGLVTAGMLFVYTTFGIIWTVVYSVIVIWLFLLVMVKLMRFDG